MCTHSDNDGPVYDIGYYGRQNMRTERFMTHETSTIRKLIGKTHH